MSRVVVILLMVALMVFSCGKQAVQEEEITEEIVEQQLKETEQETAQEAEATVQKATEVKEEAMQVEAGLSETTETLEQKEGQLEEVLELVAEGDSVDMFYMVKPNDYLSKIAKNEYGKIAMWKMIYKWNRAKIGDNPNLIFPFHEFLLKKPKADANDLEYEYYEYTVSGNESLWSIAGREYENNYAWIVLLRDNADVLGSDLENIPVGTVLKIRTALFN